MENKEKKTLRSTGSNIIIFCLDPGLVIENIDIKCNGLDAGFPFTAKAATNGYFGYQINNETGGSFDGGDTKEYKAGDTINWVLWKPIQIGDPIAIYGAGDILSLNLQGLSSTLSEISFTFGNENDNVNDNNIVTVNRTVKCDFYSSFVVYNFNDFELFGEDFEDALCNHDSNPNLTDHVNNDNSFWLCKNFRVYKESLDEYNYYLISDESVKNSGTNWILESLNRTSENNQILNHEVIDLNPFFLEDLENSSGEIYSIHFNVPKNRVDDFKTVLVAIPKNMTDVLISNDELNYNYFRVQDVNFVLKVGYK